MSIDSAKLFIDRMKTDADFSKSVIACKNSQEREAFVRNAGFDFTQEEWKDITSELTDDDLESVAGGGSASGLLNATVFLRQTPNGPRKG